MNKKFFKKVLALSLSLSLTFSTMLPLSESLAHASEVNEREIAAELPDDVYQFTWKTADFDITPQNDQNHYYTPIVDGI